MTAFQRYMLNYLEKRAAGCAYLLGRWVWPEDIRLNSALAEQLYWHVN